MKHKYSLNLNRCPHGVEMLSLDDDSGGINITGQKCCGRWAVIKSWPMSAASLQGAAREFEYAALDEYDA